MAALAVFSLAFPSLAHATGDRETPQAGTPITAAAIAGYEDRVIGGGATVAMRSASSSARSRSYITPGGQAVEIEVSASYSRDAGSDQALADFLATRLHGAELQRLRMYVGTPSEISSLCGGEDVVACYATQEQRMYVPGEASHGVPVEYPITHEYGHHVANWRDNSPWDALDWGPKHWASQKRVCSLAAEGRLFPGDQGRHYRDDPGEGFADGYAHLHHPGMRWRYNPLMRPDAAAQAAIRRDVLTPWTGPRSRTFSGRLGARTGSRSFRLRLRLDGDMVLRLNSPPGADYDLKLSTRGRTFAGMNGARKSLGVEWCRKQATETVTLTVQRRSGAGRFTLSARYPG